MVTKPKANSANGPQERDYFNTDSKDVMWFLEAAADWADDHHMDVKFIREAFEAAWMALVEISDARGVYSAYVPCVGRRNNGEKQEDYTTRVRAELSRAVMAARKKRAQSKVPYLAAR